jgi:DNA replication protein DnaC
MTATTTVPTMTPSAPGEAETYWTRERVYTGAIGYVPTPGPLGMYPMPPRPNLVDERDPRRRSCFSEEFRAELLRETDWQYIDDYTLLTDEEYQIIRDGGACPRCSIQGYHRRLKGTVTGIVITERCKCLCKCLKLFLGIWHDTKLVPQRFRSVNLDSLVPVGAPTSKLPIETQKTVIATLQKNPDRSFLLIGDAGTGKTHFSFALYHVAVLEWAWTAFENEDMWEQSVFRFNVKSLLDQHVAWATKADDNTKEPDLTVMKITALVNKGHKVSLFLDEIDKFNPTKYKMDCLLELVDAVYVGKGQVVAVSNAPVSKLEKIWGEFTDPDAIIRRIRGEEANGTQITFRAG